MSTTPICRCRVLYLGSSVPHITKDGLQGIQEPLRELYPDQGPFTAKGIDSWLSVWSNGLLLENVDESRRQITRFFPIESLHYCAAVRYVVVPGGSSDRVEKFLPLDSPFAKHATTQPPLFACILRRTSGIKVLECHAFIAKKETAANALVRCCFHAYADSMYARQLEENPYYMETKRAQMPAFNPVDKVEAWRHLNGRELPERPSPSNGTNGHHVPPSESDLTNANDKTMDEENYKVWVGAAPTEREMIYMDTAGTVRSVRSTTAGSTLGGTQAGVKPNRPRQMILPAGPPPPPPIPPAGLGGRPGQKDNNKGNNKKGKGGKYALNGGFPNVHPGQHHQHSIYAAAGYYSERQAKRVERPVLSSMEEPLYLPSTRPLSPVASYQPGQFPYEQYYSLQQQQQQQYATTTRTGKKNKKKSGDKSDKSSDADSPFNTGIYRKKGHLNERAFSYSIRQEHRSRSTSLANLHFMTNGEDQPPTENGHPTNGNASPEELTKKERELAQMVTDLRIRENGHGSHGHQHASTNGGGPGPSGHQSSSHHSGSSDSNFIRKKAPAYHQR